MSEMSSLDLNVLIRESTSAGSKYTWNCLLNDRVLDIGNVGFHRDRPIIIHYYRRQISGGWPTHSEF